MTAYFINIYVCVLKVCICILFFLLYMWNIGELQSITFLLTKMREFKKLEIMKTKVLIKIIHEFFKIQLGIKA